MLENELGKDNVIGIMCDVTKEEDVKNAIETTVKTFGGLHVAIACAGVAFVV